MNDEPAWCAGFFPSTHIQWQAGAEFAVSSGHFATMAFLLK
jgi:hypothetical protein